MARSFSHWTPRYVAGRLGYLLHERLHPDKPWLTQEAVRFLDQYLSKDDAVLEFGSGRSTLYFARRCKRVVSFENDRAWYDRVAPEARRLGNVDYRCHAGPAYYEEPAEFDDASFDLVLVDGWARERTANVSLSKLKPGGLMVVDNVNWFLPNESRAPNSKRAWQLERAEDQQWKAFVDATEGWRRYWTSNDYFDTLMLFKPAAP